MYDEYANINEPEKLTRTQRIQRRVATSLIRPASAKTGEQRSMIKGDDDYHTNVTPSNFAESIENDKRFRTNRDIQLTNAMSEMEWINSLSHDEQNEARLSIIRNDANNKIKRLSAPLEPTQTSKHVTLAALLGKHAVGYALSDDNPAMSKDVKNKTNQVVMFEDPKHGPVRIWEKKDLGAAKATHRAETRTLTRGQRMKERIAPYRAVVHELSDSYGGPQEGGWTYETGTPVHTSRGFITKRGAEKEVERLQQQYPRAKNGRNILNMRASDVYQMDADQGAFEPLEYTDNMAEAMGMPSTFIQEPEDEDYDYSFFGRPSNDYQVTLAYGNIGQYPKRKPYYE